MFYIYFDDGYYENGDVGFKDGLETEDEVTEFIENRLSEDSNRSIDCYTVIQGNEIKIKSVKQTVRVQFDR